MILQICLYSRPLSWTHQIKTISHPAHKDDSRSSKQWCQKITIKTDAYSQLHFHCGWSSFFFFGHTMKFVGFYFPEQGLAVKARSPIHQTVREFPTVDHIYLHIWNLLCHLKTILYFISNIRLYFFKNLTHYKISNYTLPQNQILYSILLCCTACEILDP